MDLIGYFKSVSLKEILIIYYLLYSLLNSERSVPEEKTRVKTGIEGEGPAADGRFLCYRPGYVWMESTNWWCWPFPSMIYADCGHASVISVNFTQRIMTGVHIFPIVSLRTASFVIGEGDKRKTCQTYHVCHMPARWRLSKMRHNRVRLNAKICVFRVWFFDWFIDEGNGPNGFSNLVKFCRKQALLLRGLFLSTDGALCINACVLSGVKWNL